MGDLWAFKVYADIMRKIYRAMAPDPDSLANLDQDLPNYLQDQIPIFSLPQEWLWCESWCSPESKAAAKTIDLCQNPLTKEHKLDMAARIAGPIWARYDDYMTRVNDGEDAGAFDAVFGDSTDGARPGDEL